MLNAVIRFSLKFRALIVFLSLAALVYGGYTMAHLPIDVFPDLDRPRVVIMTEAPGYAPEDVESLITFPLETALNGATGVESVRSQSGPGLSVVTVNFGWGTNIFTARQIVQERMNTVAMPEPGIIPQLSPISSIMGQIITIGMTRVAGPNGGVLAPVPKTDLMAELVIDPKTGEAAVYLWNPTVRADPAKWTNITGDASSVVLRWFQPAPIGRIADDEEQSLSLKRDSSGKYSAVDPRFQVSPGGPPIPDIDRTATIRIENKAYDVVFGNFTKRQMDLRTIADWVIRQRLLKVAGVAQVVVMGGGRKQYQVWLDPVSMQTYDVSLEEVERVLAANNVNLSAAFRTEGDKEQPIRYVGRIQADQVVSNLERLGVKKSGQTTIPLSRVARIVESPQIKRGDSSINGEPGVLLTVTKQPHVDTRKLTNDIKLALHGDSEKGIVGVVDSLSPDIEVNTELFQLKRFIDLGIFNVGEALVIGAILVLIILFLFLLNFRTTFISLTAIPLSLVITAMVFKAVSVATGADLSINVMTLGGIAVAMGELVDDAIVDVENIFRRLKENNALAAPRSAIQVIYEASVEVRSAIVFGTIMVILVFIPLFALSGIEGRLFTPLGVAYIVSILASLLVSLTVTPVLSYYLLPQSKATHRKSDSMLLRVLKKGAAGLIRFSMARAGSILFISWVMVAIAAYLLTRIGADFLPPFDEGSVQVNVSLPPGKSLEESNKVSAIVDARFRKLRKSPDNPHGVILSYFRRTGRAELDEHAEPVTNTEYIIAVNPESGKTREEVLAVLRAELKDARLGASVEVEQPLAHLISHMLSGVQAQVAIKVYGDDLDQLRGTAENIKAVIAKIPGVTDVAVESQQQVEEIHIAPKRDELLRNNVDSQHLADFVRTALYGKTVSQVVDGERRFDVVVRLDPSEKLTPAAMRRLLIEIPGGDPEPSTNGEPPKPRRTPRVALGTLADIEEGIGPNAVGRDNVRRRIVIRCNVSGRDLASAVGDIQRQVSKDVKMPEGYFVEYGGQFQSQQDATRIIAILALVSFAGMFFVLLMLYPSIRIVLQLLNALPMAFIGGVLALLVTQQTLSVASMVGFISLGGIAARNGILLVSHYFHLMKHEGEGFTPEMVMRGSLERLAPVLMTALTAGIALIPLVVGGHAPGREILYPVATVILGGLITSTLCEYLVHPGLFYRFSGKDAERVTKEMEAEFQSGSTTSNSNHSPIVNGTLP